MAINSWHANDPSPLRKPSTTACELTWHRSMPPPFLLALPIAFLLPPARPFVLHTMALPHNTRIRVFYALLNGRRSRQPHAALTSRALHAVEAQLKEAPSHMRARGGTAHPRNQGRDAGSSGSSTFTTTHAYTSSLCNVFTL
mmetsp:Transcript_41380/g.102087  ORF Transcript_41380/g.102087 Transcript_41380/m.102087 type:complete len:142 (-) Transcript_41380:313-738(-)